MAAFSRRGAKQGQDNVPGWDRFDPFETWHFLNVPRTTSVVEDSHCHDNCVLTGIAHHAEALTSGSSDEARAEALFFLGHWVGDIHQPLHISYTDDRWRQRHQPDHGWLLLVPATCTPCGIPASLRKPSAPTAGASTLTSSHARSHQPRTPRGSAAERSRGRRNPDNLATRPKARYCAWRDLSDQSTCAGIAKVPARSCSNTRTSSKTTSSCGYSRPEHGLRTCFGATSLNLDAQIPMIMHGRGLEAMFPGTRGSPRTGDGVGEPQLDEGLPADTDSPGLAIDWHKVDRQENRHSPAGLHGQAGWPFPDQDGRPSRLLSRLHFIRRAAVNALVCASTALLRLGARAGPR